MTSLNARAGSAPHVTAAAALGSLSAARRLASDLEGRRTAVMVLKGPPLQRRLFGTDCAYESCDIDLLVRRGTARTVRGLLRSQGWEFLSANGVMWRVDRAAAFTREGVTIDLHWGIHANAISARRLRPLEAALWEGATRAPDGWWEPLPEPLVVYLAVNWAGHSYEGPQRLASVHAAAGLVRDWERVQVVARAARVSAVVDHALFRQLHDDAGVGPALIERGARDAASRALAWARTRSPAAVSRLVRDLRVRMTQERVLPPFRSCAVPPGALALPTLRSDRQPRARAEGVPTTSGGSASGDVLTSIHRLT